MQRRCFHLGLIGYPLTHSRSPELHQAALAAAGLEGEYRLFSLPPTTEGIAEIKGLINAIRGGNLQGLNVTIPHKQTVIPFLERLTDVAQAVRAVNTIYVDREGALTGDNTDVPGFLYDLRRLVGSQTGRALVLGAGGAARAVVYGLASMGWQVEVLARRVNQAAELIDEMRWPNSHAGQLHADVLTPETLAQVKCNLIVNTTPLGMYPNVEGCPWPETVPFPPDAAIYDLIYNPLETTLVSRARAVHRPAMTGAGMLAAQAALSFQRWTGLEPPFETMFNVFHLEE